MWFIEQAPPARFFGHHAVLTNFLVDLKLVMLLGCHMDDLKQGDFVLFQEQLTPFD